MLRHIHENFNFWDQFTVNDGSFRTSTQNIRLSLLDFCIICFKFYSVDKNQLVLNWIFVHAQYVLSSHFPAGLQYNSFLYPCIVFAWAPSLKQRRAFQRLGFLMKLGQCSPVYLLGTDTKASWYWAELNCHTSFSNYIQVLIFSYFDHSLAVHMENMPLSEMNLSFVLSQGEGFWKSRFCFN